VTARARDGRIRVLRVIARMNVGGPALQVTGLAEGLDPGRFEHRVLTGSVGPDEADYLALRAPHLHVTRVAGLGRSVHALDDLRALRALVREVRAFQPHIVHTHTAKAGVLGRLAARAGGAPAVVHTFHGHLLHGYFSPAVTRAVVQVERTLARSSTRLVAVGAQVRDELLAAGIGRREQYRVVPPGLQLPPAPPRAQARAALDLPQEGELVVLVARLTSVKRPERFVDVAARLRAAHPSAVFAVVGEGDLLEDLRRQDDDLGAGVRFLGWRGDVETVYAAADVAVITSDNEGMPVSLIEAALAGVPAVATRVGSVAEVVEDDVTGLLTGTDVEELAAAVGRLLSDAPLRRRMAQAAAERARRLFGRERLVADTSDLYEEVVEEKGMVLA
jgi:glycosyltransferase involved in cell wall biosynthesis